MSDWDPATGSLDLQALRRHYEAGGTPENVIEAVFDRIAARGNDPAWTALRPRSEVLDDARALDRADLGRKPLWGVPFGVKDNLDLAGMDTTNGCRAFARRATATTPIV
ncbi:MAG: amidase family protein, partial [Pseudomonadota bacterium]